MNIDTELKQYTEIAALESMEGQLQQFEFQQESSGRDLVRVNGPKEHLKKLQDDLRKAGYRKMR